MFNKVRKKYILPLSLAVCVSLVATGCGDSQQTQGINALPVDVYTVMTKDVPVVSRLTGRVNATRQAEVRPQVSGVIQKRLFVEGSVVKEGEQLYQIDPAIYEADLDSAKANLAAAEATLHTSKLRANRYAQLLKTKAVSKQEYDDAQATFLSAKANVKAAQAQVNRAKINLKYTKVYAPITGVISRSNITEGALVGAQQTTPLTTIQQLDPMYVDLGQSVEDHLQLRQAIKAGKFKLADGKAQVDIYFSNGQKYEFPGVLEFSEVNVDESTGMVNIRATVTNPDKLLLPGMFVRGDLSEGIVPNAILVDQKAVIREAAGVAFVYIIDDKGVAHRQNIVIAGEHDGFYLVSQGLKKGDKVVLSNLQKVRTGAPVVDIAQMQQAKAQEQ